MLEEAYRGIREAEQAVEVTDLAPVDAIRRIAELTFDHHREHPDFIRPVSIENIHRGEFIRRIDPLRTGSQPIVTLLDDCANAAAPRDAPFGRGCVGRNSSYIIEVT